MAMEETACHRKEVFALLPDGVRSSGLLALDDIQAKTAYTHRVDAAGTIRRVRGYRRGALRHKEVELDGVSIGVPSDRKSPVPGSDKRHLCVGWPPFAPIDRAKVVALNRNTSAARSASPPPFVPSSARRAAAISKTR